MKPIALTTENFILLIILMVSAALRIIGLEGFSYSADEVSALLRTDFNSYSDLIYYGVKTRDMHPAGVQSFLYYWTHWFGYGEWVVRLPFVLMGFISVFYTYKIGRKWFNVHTGLIAAALICGLEYFITYSEIARPYSPGLCFTLLVVWYWDKIMFSRDVRVGAYLGFGFFCLMCLYTHYYSGIVALIIGVSGFLYIDKKHLKAYLFTGVGIILLFLPHINITLYQMDTGGLHGWLGPPNKYWLFNYLFTLFNSSWLLLIGLGIILMLSAFYQLRKINITHKHLICLSWFILSFLFGFIYSRSFSPILQASVMLFAAPFLILPLADMIQLARFERKALIIPVVILVLTSLSTVVEKDYFNQTHFGVLEELSEKNIEWEKTYGSINMSTNVSDQSYMRFFEREKGLVVDYDVYTLNNENDWDSLLLSVFQAESNFYSYSWSTRANPVIAQEMIRLKYPFVLENIHFENSQITLFSKTEGQALKPIRSIDLNLELDDLRYFHNLDLVREQHPEYGTCIHMKPEQEFGLEIKIPITDLSINPNEFIRCSFDVLEPNQKGITFVYQIEREGVLLKQANGEDAWFGRNSKAYMQTKGWNKFVHARVIDDIIEEEDIAKFFFWNHNQTDVYIKNIRIEVFKKI